MLASPVDTQRAVCAAKKLKSTIEKYENKHAFHSRPQLQWRFDGNGSVGRQQYVRVPEARNLGRARITARPAALADL